MARPPWENPPPAEAAGEPEDDDAETLQADIERRRQHLIAMRDEARARSRERYGRSDGGDDRMQDDDDDDDSDDVAQSMEDGPGMSAEEIDAAIKGHPIRRPPSPIHMRIISALFTNQSVGIRHRDIRWGESIDMHADWFLDRLPKPTDEAEHSDDAEIVATNEESSM